MRAHEPVRPPQPVKVCQTRRIGGEPRSKIRDPAGVVPASDRPRIVRMGNGILSHDSTPSRCSPRPRRLPPRGDTLVSNALSLRDASPYPHRPRHWHQDGYPFQGNLGRDAVRTHRQFFMSDGELLARFHMSGPGDHGEGLRRSRDDAAGV